MTSPSALPMGRKAPDYTKPRLWLEDYRVGSVPAAIYPVDRGTMVPQLPMYLNDQLGDCTIAEQGHAIGCLSVNSGEPGGEVLFANPEIQSVYSAVGGYVPGNPNTDNGCVMSEVFANWQANGITDTNGKLHVLSAYAQLVHTTPADLNWALKNFGSVHLGINCPQSAQDEFAAGQPWVYVQGSPVVGGHCVGLQVMPALGVYQVTTWGKLQTASQSFLDHYLEEAWVTISPDWLRANGTTVTGLKVPQLLADMAILS